MTIEIRDEGDNIDALELEVDRWVTGRPAGREGLPVRLYVDGTVGHPRAPPSPPSPRPGGSDPSRVPSVPPAVPASFYLSVCPRDRPEARPRRPHSYLSRTPGRRLPSRRPAPLGRRGGTTRRRPRRPRRRRTPCWPRTPPSCLSRPSVCPSPLSLSMLCSSPCSLLFPSPLPFLPLLSSPRSVGPSFLRLFSLVQHCNAAPPSSCSPCYCAEYVLLGFPPDKIPCFYNQKTTF